MKKVRLRKDRIIKVSLAIVLVIVTSVLALRGCFDSVENLSYPIEYTEYVEKYAKEYNIDTALLYAIIRTESGFDPKAVSSENAMGLTQILPSTFTWLLTKTDEDLPIDALYEPETAIKYGALLLNILYQQFEETDVVIAAYHAGVGNVGNWLKNGEYSDDGKTLKKIPFADTEYYVKKVTDAVEVYKKLLREN